MVHNSAPKRKQDDEDIVSASKRQRSGSASSVVSSASDIDEEQNTPLDTPATPLTPSTPSKSSSYRPKIYLCTYDGCDKAFARPVRLDEHIRSHTKSRIFKCPYDDCDKDFLRESHLNHHIKMKHTGIRDYVCTWTGCDKAFATGQRLRTHEEAHIGKEKYKCTAYPPCTETFRKRVTLQMHIDINHLHRKAFRCSQCSSGFDVAGRLRAHEKRMHGEKRHWCTICVAPNEDDTESSAEPRAVGFVTTLELQDHLRLQHPPMCNECSITYSSVRELQRHIDIHHSGIALEDRQTFTCPVVDCGKGFTKKSNLNYHVKSVHENKKPFICGATDLSTIEDLTSWNGNNACGYAFGAKASLINHVRRAHVGDKSQTTSKKTTKKKDKALQESSAPSALARLTGVGYEEESGRGILCIVETCPFRFKRQYDLEVHARATHDMPDEDIAEALAEREALTGGKFWIGSAEDEDQDEDEDDMLRAGGLSSPKSNMQHHSVGETVSGATRSQLPSAPKRASNLAGKYQSTRDVSPSDFETLDFQALASFCELPNSIV